MTLSAVLVFCVIQLSGMHSLHSLQSLRPIDLFCVFNLGCLLVGSLVVRANARHASVDSCVKQAGSHHITQRRRKQAWRAFISEK